MLFNFTEVLKTEIIVNELVQCIMLLCIGFTLYDFIVSFIPDNLCQGRHQGITAKENLLIISQQLSHPSLLRKKNGLQAHVFIMGVREHELKSKFLTKS